MWWTSIRNVIVEESSHYLTSLFLILTRNKIAQTEVRSVFLSLSSLSSLIVSFLFLIRFQMHVTSKSLCWVVFCPLDELVYEVFPVSSVSSITYLICYLLKTKTKLSLWSAMHLLVLLICFLVFFKWTLNDWQFFPLQRLFFIVVIFFFLFSYKHIFISSRILFIVIFIVHLSLPSISTFLTALFSMDKLSVNSLFLAVASPSFISTFITCTTIPQIIFFITDEFASEKYGWNSSGEWGSSEQFSVRVFCQENIFIFDFFLQRWCSFRLLKLDVKLTKNVLRNTPKWNDSEKKCDKISEKK